MISAEQLVTYGKEYEEYHEKELQYFSVLNCSCGHVIYKNLQTLENEFKEAVKNGNKYIKYPKVLQYSTFLSLIELGYNIYIDTDNIAPTMTIGWDKEYMKSLAKQKKLKEVSVWAGLVEVR